MGGLRQMALESARYADAVCAALGRSACPHAQRASCPVDAPCAVNTARDTVMPHAARAPSSPCSMRDELTVQLHAPMRCRLDHHRSLCRHHADLHRLCHRHAALRCAPDLHDQHAAGELVMS